MRKETNKRKQSHARCCLSASVVYLLRASERMRDGREQTSRRDWAWSASHSISISISISVTVTTLTAARQADEGLRSGPVAQRSLTAQPTPCCVGCRCDRCAHCLFVRSLALIAISADCHPNFPFEPTNHRHFC